MAEYAASSNDAFAAFVRKAEEDEKSRSTSTGSSGKNMTYESQTWVGLEQNQAHILRLVGNPPESMTKGFKGGPTDAHEIFFETVKDDKGSTMQLRLPCHAADINDEHIMWRIISRVKEVEWVDDPENPGKRKKVFKYEKLPIFDKITHSGYSATIPAEANKYRYAKGWGGQQVCIMNVIDREDNWCKENKHTKLLSKRVTESNGIAYPTVGVPSYGFLSALAHLCQIYGSWEKYDIQVVKTGQMNSPYIVKNASFYKSSGVPEIDQTKLDVISLEPGLTAEEQAYERYDIAKFYAPTSYKNLKNRLGNTIKEVDATLHTNFYDELVSLAEKEEAEKASLRESEEAAPAAPTFVVGTEPVTAAPTAPATPVVAPVTPAPAAPVEAAPIPTPTAAPVATPTRGTRNISVLAPEKIAALKGWLKLTDANKSQIADVVLAADGTVENVLYTEGAATQCNCNNCMKPSPQDFMSCPVCGLDFE